MNTSLIQQLAREAGATAEDGTHAVGPFCFTSQELDEFVSRIVKTIAADVKITANQNLGSTIQEDQAMCTMAQAMYDTVKRTFA